MDPVSRVRDYLLDNIGHMTYPGSASFDPSSQHWYVPVVCRTAKGVVVVGDVEVDSGGRIVYAPSREEMVTRLETASRPAAPAAIP